MMSMPMPLACVVFAMLLMVGCQTSGPTPLAVAAPTGKLRHVVYFKFKEGTSPEMIRQTESRFRQLPAKISQIVGYEWGTNHSPEGKAEGFTHCFLVTFADAKGRDVYLPHPAHQEFVKFVIPILDKVMVIDYDVRE